MSTFSERVRKAREYARLSQTALAERLGVKQQAVQYLENAKHAARGSRHTAAIARVTGVSADWLMSGQGPMLLLQAAEPPAHYGELSPEAVQVATAWDKLSSQSQATMRDLLFMLAAAERHYPWLQRGRPRTETYDEYERRIGQNFAALKVLGAPNKAKA